MGPHATAVDAGELAAALERALDDISKHEIVEPPGLTLKLQAFIEFCRGGGFTRTRRPRAGLRTPPGAVALNPPPAWGKSLAGKIVRLRPAKPTTGKAAMDDLASVTTTICDVHRELMLARAALVGLCREIIEHEIPSDDVLNYLRPLEDSLVATAEKLEKAFQ